MECLEHRIRLSSGAGWHLEPEDETSQEQKELCLSLTRIIKRMRRFTEMRRVLMEAIWYGRYAVQYRWRDVRIAGRNYRMPFRAANEEGTGWLPIHGDKLVFRYDPDSPLYGPNKELLGPIGVNVNLAFVPERIRPYIHQSENHMAYFAPLWQRRMFCIHKHQIEDAPFEEPLQGGTLHGVGIRSRIYWEWFQKQEVLGFLMDFVERSSLGIEIWEYPAGNPEAEQKCRDASSRRSGSNKNVVLFPKPLGEDSQYFDVRHVEPGVAGAQALQELIEKYFGHRIKRYILGQTLSSEADSTGLGSGVADAHLDTLMQIIRYDTDNLDETLTNEFVEPLKEANFPHASDIHIKFVSEIDEPDMDRKLEAFSKAYEMGARLREADVLEMIGASVPQADDVVLSNKGQEPSQGMPGDESQPDSNEEIMQEVADSLNSATSVSVRGDFVTSGQSQPEGAATDG